MSTALDAAIAANLSHAPGSLADGLTESLLDQALTRPAELDPAALQADAAAAGLPTGWHWVAVYACTFFGSLLAAHLWPWAWF